MSKSVLVLLIFAVLALSIFFITSFIGVRTCKSYMEKPAREGKIEHNFDERQQLKDLVVVEDWPAMSCGGRRIDGQWVPDWDFTTLKSRNGKWVRSWNFSVFKREFFQYFKIGIAKVTGEWDRSTALP